MSAFTVVLIVVVLITCGHFIDEKDFDLRDLFPKPSGARQSPIDIAIFNTVIIDDFQPIRIPNLRAAPEKIQVRNIGTTVKYFPKYQPENRPTLLGGPLQGDYLFHNVEFHWGATDNVGSEHTIDQQQFSLEMQIFFIKKEFETMAKATLEKDGIAIVAFLFEVKDGAEQKVFIPSLKKVQKYQSGVVLRGNDAFSLGDLLGPTTWNFASYPGSRTLEPFRETVTWLINLRSLDISPEDLNEFRQMLDANGAPLINNFREVQPLEDRHVELYLDDEDDQE